LLSSLTIAYNFQQTSAGGSSSSSSSTTAPMQEEMDLSFRLDSSFLDTLCVESEVSKALNLFDHSLSKKNVLVLEKCISMLFQRCQVCR